MERDRGEADHPLDISVNRQWVTPAVGPAGREPRAPGHAAHEDREHQCLRVRRVTQEELDVVRPDRFVNQAGKAGDREQNEEYDWAELQVSALHGGRFSVGKQYLERLLTAWNRGTLSRSNRPNRHAPGSRSR